MEDTEFEGMVKGKLKGLYIYRLPWWRRLSVYNAGDLGSIPGLGRSPGEGNGNPLQYYAWKIPRTEEPGRLQSMGSQRFKQD